MPGKHPFEGILVVRRHGNDKPAGAFRKQQGVVPVDAFRRNPTQVHRQAQLPPHGHKAQMNGQSSAVNAVAGSQKPLLDRCCHAAVTGGKVLGIDDRGIQAHMAQVLIVLRPAQFVFGDPDDPDPIPGDFGIHGEALVHVLDHTGNRELQGLQRRDLVGFTIAARQMPIHVHGVLAGQQRDAIGQAHRLERLARTHQLGGFMLAVGIFQRIVLDVGPTEIVHTAQMIRVPAHGDGPAHGLVNGAGGHVIGIDGRDHGDQGL